MQEEIADITNPYNLDWHESPVEMVKLEGATKIIVETPDEFLASFDIDDFNNPQIIQWMKKREIEANQIGQASAMGRLFSIPEEKYVLKIVNVCPQNVKHNLVVKQLCKAAHKGDIVYRIPNTSTGKMSVFAPDYMLEGVMGILLSRMKKNTPGFVRIYGFQYDPQPPEKPLYIMMESLQSAGNSFIDSKSLMFGMFQIAQTLAVAQKLSRYTHYDLHAGNIMTRKLKKRRTRIYELGDGNYLYTKFDFDTVIIDYGLNRMETDDNVLLGSSTMKVKDGPHRDVLDFRAFNPYTDLITILLYIAYNVGVTNNNQLIIPWPNISREQGNLVFRLLSYALNMDSATDDQILEVINNHIMSSGHNWRPSPDKLAMTYTNNGGKTIIFKGCRTPQQFMVKFAEEIKKGVPVPPNDRGSLSDYLDTHYFAVLDRILKPGKTSKIYALPDMRKQMDTSFLNYKVAPTFTENVVFSVAELLPDFFHRSGVRTEYKPFNVTRVEIPGSKTEMPAREIYGHVATINVSEGHKLGFKFNFECCRIDPRAYMQESNKNGCIAVNAAFFRIDDNFTPVGYFRSPNYSSQTPFPPNYGQFYGILGVNNEGKLDIDPDLNNFTMFDSALSCGPVLVYGDRILDDNDIESNELLQWPKVSNVKVKPGELAHVANPNPRTAIGILRDGNVRIVYIEGRGERGAGVDCSQLAQICKALDMVKAINLDGGRSSQLVWRAPGSNEISISSSHTDGYPVGSIISFCK